MAIRFLAAAQVRDAGLSLPGLVAAAGGCGRLNRIKTLLKKLHSPLFLGRERWQSVLRRMLLSGYYLLSEQDMRIIRAIPYNSGFVNAIYIERSERI